MTSLLSLKGSHFGGESWMTFHTASHPTAIDLNVPCKSAPKKMLLDSCDIIMHDSLLDSITSECQTLGSLVTITDASPSPPKMCNKGRKRRFSWTKTTIRTTTTMTTTRCACLRCRHVLVLAYRARFPFDACLTLCFASCCCCCLTI